ncbi:MAG: helix-turn-helix transcriptional regulator [Clostridia bacterium]|nr:helix-turn-helix transcriptional regulator [Clostridia bacterium]
MEFQGLENGEFLFFEDKINPKDVPGGPRHFHNMLELYFMERGSCHYFIDDKLYRVAEGDLVLIPEGILHKTRYEGGERRRRLVYCSRHFAPPDMDLSPLPYLYRNSALTPRIRQLLEEVKHEFDHPDAFSKEVLRRQMHLLFYLLIRNAQSCASVQPSTLYTEQTIACIKEQYASDLTLTELAKQMGISPEHLSRVFKRETGFGFSEYLTTVRLQKAEQLLKADPSRRVAEVAFACGFNDSNYFSHKFKQIYGFPPGKLRAKC